MDKETIRKLKSIKWTKNSFTLKHIEDNFDFPVITKIAEFRNTKKYSLENPYFYLIGKRFLTKIVAQTIEKGNYVIGKVIEIPTNSSIKFRVTDNFERLSDTVRTFESVEKIAASTMPTVVYLNEQLVFNNTSQSNIFFQRGDEFRIIGPSSENIDEQKKSPPKKFMRSKLRNDAINLKKKKLVMYNTRLQLTINIPYSVKANFTTKSPTDNSRWNNLDLTAGQLINKIDFPCTVIVKNNPNSSNLDQHHIIINTHLKLTGAEKHCFILALGIDNKFIEFQPESHLEFHIPSFLCGFNTEDRNSLDLYDELSCKILKKCNANNSSTNIDTYLQSVQYYEHRDIRKTKPTAVASLLSCRRMDDKHKSTVSVSNKVTELCTQFSRGKCDVSIDQADSDSSHAPQLPPRSNPLKQSKNNKVKRNQTHKPLPPIPTDSSESFSSAPCSVLARSRTFCDSDRHLSQRRSVSVPLYQPPSSNYLNNEDFSINALTLSDNFDCSKIAELEDGFAEKKFKKTFTLQNSFSTKVYQNKLKGNDHILDNVITFEESKNLLPVNTSIDSSEKLNGRRRNENNDQYAKCLKESAFNVSKNSSVPNKKYISHQQVSLYIIQIQIYF